MALKLLSEIGNATHVQPASLAATLAAGAPVIITGGGGEITYAFGINDYTTSTVEPDLIVAADMVEVDAAALTYLVGESVYDADAAPTGIVNKTSGAGRKKVGTVARAVTLAAQGKLKIVFDGRA